MYSTTRTLCMFGPSLIFLSPLFIFLYATSSLIPSAFATRHSATYSMDSSACLFPKLRVYYTSLSLKAASLNASWVATLQPCSSDDSVTCQACIMDNEYQLPTLRHSFKLVAEPCGIYLIKGDLLSKRYGSLVFGLQP